MQAAASTAVKAPVVAAIKYNYKPATSSFLPALRHSAISSRANRNGIVSVRFHRLQMPDGTTEAIDGTAMSLT
jgi:hypothetical protein